MHMFSLEDKRLNFPFIPYTHGLRKQYEQEIIIISWSGKGKLFPSLVFHSRIYTWQNIVFHDFMNPLAGK